ncbi:MAG TPA: 3-hydroxyacyl-CoA dehydrogenase/enoyl-CoA hydratase family protein, partial [Gammaproteobacteria bacterium]|nr:3-hydroxyacyl-CoA dehydrogenase/enoyl-CoA hydratase family protein [Gammaproteobacteria bacterium]
MLGAGVMGAQIAAHLSAAGLAVLLFDLPGRDDPDGLVKDALRRLGKLKPSPLASSATLEGITPCNYERDLARLAGCELVIEAVVERRDLKQSLYAKVAPHIGETALFATNTSGISIGELAGALPRELRPRFCGVHFFNPPRYMHLVELVAHAATDTAALDRLEGFLTTALGKGVVRAKDTPNFIGNRIGVFAILAVLHHAERLKLPLDLVDRLTGPGIGRPKSATLRTADVVGLDTLKHVVDNLAENLSGDPWHRYFRLPGWMEQLIAKGALGQKSGAGVYRKGKQGIEVLDPVAGDYRTVKRALTEEMRAFLKERDPKKKYAMLAAIEHPQAEFLRSVFLDLFHYTEHFLGEIAQCARDVDFAMRWGYGWKLGPFETWQAIGWREVAGDLEKAIAAGETMSDVPLSAWAAEREAVHTPQGSWDAADGKLVAFSAHPVYRRQVFREHVVGETAPEFPTVFENESVRLWDLGDGVAVLSFRSKGHTIGPGVLAGVRESLALAERDWKALVIWQDSEPFSYGANLKEIGAGVAAGTLDPAKMIAEFQRTSLALRYSALPTVAAVRGMALGGGCEFLLHCDRVVAALESYIGLVELGVGLVPAGGGTKEFALRAAAETGPGWLFDRIARRFELIGTAKVAGSAEEARELGFLRESDVVVFHSDELLHVAKAQALALHES